MSQEINLWMKLMVVFMHEIGTRFIRERVHFIVIQFTWAASAYMNPKQNWCCSRMISFRLKFILLVRHFTLVSRLLKTNYILKWKLQSMQSRDYGACVSSSRRRKTLRFFFHSSGKQRSSTMFFHHKSVLPGPNQWDFLLLCPLLPSEAAVWTHSEKIWAFFPFSQK